MNILFTCSARKWGGNEAWVLNAVQVLKQQHKVFLAYRKSQIGDRFTIPKIQLSFHSEADLLTLVQLVTLIRKNRIDIVVPTKRKDYFLAGLACRLTGAKNIIILGIVRNLQNTALNNLIYNMLADGIMVNAQMIKDVLLQSSYMRSEKIAVIPNGISIDIDSVVAAEKPAAFLITSLGELSERKGFDFLIRGFARFVKTNCIADAGLTIIGAGGQMEHLKTLCQKLDVERKVTLTGFRKDPYPLLRSSEVFALTSKNEGIPYAIIEAALCGNAIIATKAGGIEELLMDRQHCLYVDYGNEDVLADLLLQLYNDPTLRNKLACNARLAAEEKFSLEKMEREMIGFFRTILRKDR